MSNYEEKKQARIDRYKDLSVKADNNSNASYKESRRMSEVIPFGQPILVGHHSERKHRNLIERRDNKMRKSIEEQKKSEYYADKARAAENNNSISGDDPEAVKKLKIKLEKLQKYQDTMKWANKIIRSKKLDKEEKKAQLSEKFDIEIITAILKPDFMGRIGFARYQLTNNGANIRSTKQRIEKLLKLATSPIQETRRIGDIEIIENVEANRIQVIFPGKPEAEIRTQLKQNGFRWSPRGGCWQAFRKAGKAAHTVDLVSTF